MAGRRDDRSGVPVRELTDEEYRAYARELYRWRREHWREFFTDGLLSAGFGIYLVLIVIALVKYL